MKTPKGMICQIIEGTNGFPITHCTKIAENIKKHVKGFKERSEAKSMQWCAKAKANKGGATKATKWQHNELAQNGVE